MTEFTVLDLLLSLRPMSENNHLEKQTAEQSAFPVKSIYSSNQHVENVSNVTINVRWQSLPVYILWLFLGAINENGSSQIAFGKTVLEKWITTNQREINSR